MKEAIIPINPKKRREQAEDIREKAIDLSQTEALPKLMNNGEEEEYLQQLKSPVANFTKGLHHDSTTGEVRLADYEKLRDALERGQEKDFADVPRSPEAGRKWTAPQTGLAFDLQGRDAWSHAIAPVPKLDSRKNDGEMMELYWMALLRDVPFLNYESDPGVQDAVKELDAFRNEGRVTDRQDIFDTPRLKRITPATVFRGFTEGDLKGPYISQFLLHEAPFGSLTIDPRQRTFPPGIDYMTRFEDWLKVQNGVDTTLPDDKLLEPAVVGKRYIRSMRDLARYVHVDALHEAYFNAALILLQAANLPLDDGNPYVGDNTSARNQMGFGVFGDPALLVLLTEVATRALKAVWFQKWFVHRRLRPEEWGGRIDVARRKKVANYPVNKRLLDSVAHQRILAKHGSSLLPQAFPEGSPMHPSYGTGHGTVAGACVTILKAWFKGGNVRIQDLRRRDGSPLLPLKVASADGMSLVDYTGADAEALTVDGELNKLAANIATGRNGAGVHWRSDYTQSVRLGEEVALGILREQSILYNEKNHFTVVAFDGRHIRIADGKIRVTSTPKDVADAA